MTTVASEPRLFMARAVKCVLLSGAILMTAPSNVSAEEPTVILMQQTLPDISGKVVTVLTVRYGPGTASDAHVHPGSVFAYVLEGAVVSQLEGEKPVTYSKGQSWYEPPKQPHLVSKNASNEEPAKILVFLLAHEGEAIKAPVKIPEAGR